MKWWILRSLVENDGFKYDYRKEKSDKIKRYEDAAPTVKEYESIIKSQKRTY